MTACFFWLFENINQMKERNGRVLRRRNYGVKILMSRTHLQYFMKTVQCQSGDKLMPS